MSKAPAIVFGTAGVAAFSTEQLNEVFDILEKHNVKELDTARLYVRLHCFYEETMSANCLQGPSEEVLKKAGAPKRFTISTKALGFTPGAMSKSGILESVDTSFKNLEVEQVRL